MGFKTLIFRRKGNAPRCFVFKRNRQCDLNQSCYLDESIFGNFRLRRIIFRMKKSKVLRQWSHEKTGKKALIPNSFHYLDQCQNLVV